MFCSRNVRSPTAYGDSCSLNCLSTWARTAGAIATVSTSMIVPRPSHMKPVASIPHIKTGRLYPIGITTPKRNPAVPDVPSIGETVPGYAVTHWYGIWGPKGIPREIVARMNQEFAKVIHSDTVKKWLAAEGMLPAAGPPEQFRDRVKSDVAQWKKLVKEANIVLTQ